MRNKTVTRTVAASVLREFSEHLRHGRLPHEADAWLLMRATEPIADESVQPHDQMYHPTRLRYESVGSAQPSVSEALDEAVIRAGVARQRLAAVIRRALPGVGHDVMRCLYPPRDHSAAHTSAYANLSQFCWPPLRQKDAAKEAQQLRDALALSPELIDVLQESSILQASARRMMRAVQPQAAELCSMQNLLLQSDEAKLAARYLKAALVKVNNGATSNFFGTSAAAVVLRVAPILAQLPNEVAAAIDARTGASRILMSIGKLVDSRDDPSRQPVRQLAIAAGPAAVLSIQWTIWCAISEALLFGEPTFPGAPFEQQAKTLGSIAGYGWLRRSHLPGGDSKNAVMRWCRTWETLAYSRAMRGIKLNGSLAEMTRRPADAR